MLPAFRRSQMIAVNGCDHCNIRMQRVEGTVKFIGFHYNHLIGSLHEVGFRSSRKCHPKCSAIISAVAKYPGDHGGGGGLSV